MVPAHLGKWVWTSRPLGGRTLNTAFQGPCSWTQRALQHFACHQGRPYPQWKCLPERHAHVAPCVPDGRLDIDSHFACVGHHCKRPMQCQGEARQTQSLKGQLVSKACCHFSFLWSQLTRVQWGQPGKLRSHGVHPRLGNTPVLPCPSSSPFGCAVYAIDVQPGLESHRHLPDRPSSGPKTRGGVGCPRGPARGGSGRAT